MGRVICFIGRSGCGKTTLLDELRKRGRLPILSNTTRDRRPGEKQGVEYNFMPQSEFDAYASQERFLKVYRLGGACYGTFKSPPDRPILTQVHMFPSIDDALRSENDGLHVIMPDAVPALLEYAGSKFKAFYVLSPGDDVLRKRMLARGEPPDKVNKRMALDAHWDLDAKKSGLPYVFIRNDGDTIAPAVEEVLRYLNC